MLDRLICPRDRLPLTLARDRYRCPDGHAYPVVDGVPVLLVPEAPQTIGVAAASAAAAESGDGAPLYLDTLGIAPHEKEGIRGAAEGPTPPLVDPVVSWIVAATSGWAYLDRLGKLDSYLIPQIPLEDGNGRVLLDVGCNWGRWSFAAARMGWRVIGIDPSLGALLAAKRVVAELGLPATFVCSDARFLPFAPASFDAAFSYSVLQHFAEDDAAAALAEIGRVLKQGGLAKIQMAHRYGPRALYVQTRRRWRRPREFEVRYWTLAALREAFERAIGPAEVAAEAYGGLGLLWCDRRAIPRRLLPLLAASEVLRRAAAVAPVLRHVADSVYVTAAKTT